MMAKMMRTSYGYMTPTEAKIIGDIARDEKKQKKKYLNRPKTVRN
ncbi:hypothetical protein [Companilactobacillus jidongensis]|nr:hypothetical protein [Companilactobacillus jidongensis]